MNYKALLKYLSALLLFGSNGIIASLIDLNSLQIVLLRTFLGSILLLFLFLMHTKKFTFHKYSKDFLFLISSGIAMGMSWMFLYEAYSRIGVSISSLLYYCGPVLVMAMAPILFKEPLTIYKTSCFFTVLIGVFFMNGNLSGNTPDTIGLICGFMSAVMYALMVICNKKAAMIGGLENATLQLIFAFLTVLIFSFIKHDISIQIATTDLLPIFILGFLNTGVGCYLYFSSIDSLKIQTVTICGYLEPLSAVFFSMIFLHEKLFPLQLLGILLIMGGAAACHRRP